MRVERVPVLLGDGGYYGTLAAARALGRDAIPVTVADPSRVGCALWSRHVARRLWCPPTSETGRFVSWLRELGAAGQAHVLCATSDDWSFVLALHQAELEGPFVFYQPALESLLALLDKGRLLEHARAVGLETPDTWLPLGDDDAARAIREAGGPLVVKPRTQALLRNHAKGLVVAGDATATATGALALALEAYARFRRGYRHAPLLAERFPEMTWPMIQRFHVEAVERVYSLAGFRDRTGTHFVLRAAEKVLQRPRKLGVGVCFEHAPVDEELAARLRRLCERVGYFGIFEAEFIRVGGRSLLIDLNARIYNQIGFDIARGLPMPRLVYDAALGRDADVAARIATLREAEANGDGLHQPRAFCNRFGFAVLVGAKRLSGTMSRGEVDRWRSWLRERDGSVIDAVADTEDPRPLAFDVAKQLYSYMRHPRAFLRMIALDR
jgi:predicted ATP-grasp superfamily ATP-dependent carboligase